MMRIIPFLFVIGLAWHGLISCSYVQAVSQTNIPKNRSKIVHANTKRYIFWFFNFDNDYPYKLVSTLKSKCPNGRVTGILTKDITTLYFLMFFWAREQEVTGYCVSKGSEAAEEQINDSENEILGASDSTLGMMAQDRAFSTEIREPWVD